MSTTPSDNVPEFPNTAPRKQDARWNSLISLSESLVAASPHGVGAATTPEASPAPSAMAARATGVAAVLGAITGASRAAGRHYPAMMNGDISRGTYATRIGAAMAAEGAASAGRSATTVAVKVGVHEVACKLSASGLMRFASSAAGTLAAFAVVEQSIDSVQLARGRISREEYAARTVENISSFGAGYGGAVAGAALGSAVPVLGTAAGALVGGLVGSIGGVRLARKVLQATGRPRGLGDPRRAEVPSASAIETVGEG